MPDRDPTNFEFQAVGYSHGVAGLGAWEVPSLSRAFSPLAYLDGALTVCSWPILVFSFIHFPHSPNTGRVCAAWTQRPREDPLSSSLVSQDSCSKGTHIWECDTRGMPASAGMGVGMGQHRGSRILQLCILRWTQTGGVLSDCAACGLHGREVMNGSSWECSVLKTDWILLHPCYSRASPGMFKNLRLHHGPEAEPVL